MDTLLDDLIRIAEESATHLGHRMSWTDYNDYGAYVREDGYCMTCGAEVVVQASPIAKHVGIRGRAISAACADVADGLV